MEEIATQGELLVERKKSLKQNKCGAHGGNSKLIQDMMTLNHVEKFYENRMKNGGDRYSRIKLLAEARGKKSCKSLKRKKYVKQDIMIDDN